jgi:hypothetical protein
MKNLDSKKSFIPSLYQSYILRANPQTKELGLFLCPSVSYIYTRYKDGVVPPHHSCNGYGIRSKCVIGNGKGNAVFSLLPSSKYQIQMKAINHTSDKAAAEVRPQSKSTKLKDLDKSLLQFFLMPIPNPRGLGSFVDKENVTFTFNHYANEIVPTTSAALPPEYWYALAVHARNHLLIHLI